MSLMTPVFGLLGGAHGRPRVRLHRVGAARPAGYLQALDAVRVNTADARARAAAHQELVPACGGGAVRSRSSQRELAAALAVGRV